MCTCTGRRKKSKANWRTAWHKAVISMKHGDELVILKIQHDVKNAHIYMMDISYIYIVYSI